VAKRILLADDGNEVDVELAKAFDATVSVVSVIELMPARARGAVP
jgi:hypothetical protein